MKRWILLAWVLTLGLAAFAIAGKERLLAHGDTVYLRLAPVDPRSLMQGDYMALNFAIAESIRQAGKLQGIEPAREQVAVIHRDARGEASFVRLHTGAALAAGEQLLRFQNVPARWGGMQAQVSTDAYFFQEGQGARFEKARYGEFRVGPDGQALLVGLRGEDLGAL
ncbi:GDYXXLXY domain-containing protein [Cupriavidus basilensis]|uniref:GDYXXLXY domain-containing protein n=1 Tax=Cupriavidus basilensis TaxID=68895 RepID=A0A643FW77_9BURK|nr:GDYXXLXY domain-containing protein [Cupriavidus basilensis]QOT76082.1 GDYXXLXY domain-containing protein [Cupriavidus basilensis]